MNIYKSVKDEVLVPIHPAGWPFIFLFILVSAVATYFWAWFVLPGSFLSLWCIYFFRNPKRTTPVSDHLVISPADGRVLSTGIMPVPDDLDLPKGEWRRISIFMNVFDVHVNRAPVAGKVIATSYHKGAFLNASLDKASEQNERQNMVLEMASGQAVGVVQIAGLVARRILLEAAVGDHLNIGQQYGIIRFGSRVDVWLPASTPVAVLAGQTAVAGETILADLSGAMTEITDGICR
ncbi:MAG: phosphatidylserine decarboxylase [Candidatus Puniceispirillaceae bacterium]|jgi:phosphatidylserine decarboxylase|nr:phosphatidylserine decarboxylase [Alphaproteobacteria bacterium]HAE08758.1 phosphatidylserine decarboxylase family protein [Alphaproteobacteria bacterium]